MINWKWKGRCKARGMISMGWSTWSLMTLAGRQSQGVWARNNCRMVNFKCTRRAQSDLDQEICLSTHPIWYRIIPTIHPAFQKERKKKRKVYEIAKVAVELQVRRCIVWLEVEQPWRRFPSTRLASHSSTFEARLASIESALTALRVKIMF